MKKFLKSVAVITAGACLLGGGILVGGITSSDRDQQVQAADSNISSAASNELSRLENATYSGELQTISMDMTEFQSVPVQEPPQQVQPEEQTVQTAQAEVQPEKSQEAEAAPAAVQPETDQTVQTAPEADQTQNVYCPNGYADCPYYGNCIAGQDCKDQYRQECWNAQNVGQGGHHRESGGHHRGRHH